MPPDALPATSGTAHTLETMGRPRSTEAVVFPLLDGSGSSPGPLLVHADYDGAAVWQRTPESAVAKSVVLAACLGDHGPMTELLRFAAFTTDPKGGNPAGVWIGDALPPVDQMQRIAADVGFSETAFLAPGASGRWNVRYFSRVGEVPFCGHATIAGGVALGERFGEATYDLATPSGRVLVRVGRSRGDARLVATLVSVEPQSRPADLGLVATVLDALRWSPDDLDDRIPPAMAFAGAWHLILAVSTRTRLADLDYDFEALRTLMEEHDLTTCQLIWREDNVTFHARNPFPVGGVVEDPATGSSAAALGGYLRDGGFVRAPTRIDIHQGDDMGRPSRLRVDIPLAGGIEVTGTAVPV